MFLSLKYENKIGRIISVRAIEVISHPTTTIANGFWSSLPVPVLHIIGSNPMTEVKAVMSTGRRRTIAHSTIESCIHCLVILTFSSSLFESVHLSISLKPNFSLKAFSRYKIITTHVSTAFPNRAINQTHTATEKLKPDI